MVTLAVFQLSEVTINNGGMTICRILLKVNVTFPSQKIKIELYGIFLHTLSPKDFHFIVSLDLTVDVPFLVFEQNVTEK